MFGFVKFPTEVENKKHCFETILIHHKMIEVN